LRPKPRPPELARRIGRLGWRLFQDAENYRPRQPGTADDLFGVRPPGGRERQPGHRPRRCLLPVAALTVTAMFGERAESRLGARRPTRPKRACNRVTAMNDFTHILSNIQQGGPHAAEQLLPLVYDELRKLAAQRLAQEKPGQTLQATALVHEAYLR